MGMTTRTGSAVVIVSCCNSFSDKKISVFKSMTTVEPIPVSFSSHLDILNGFGMIGLHRNIVCYGSNGYLDFSHKLNNIWMIDIYPSNINENENKKIFYIGIVVWWLFCTSQHKIYQVLNIKKNIEKIIIKRN